MASFLNVIRTLSNVRDGVYVEITASLKFLRFLIDRFLNTHEVFVALYVT